MNDRGNRGGILWQTCSILDAYPISRTERRGVVFHLKKPEGGSTVHWESIRGQDQIHRAV